MSLMSINYQYFSLLTFLGEIIELKLQKTIFWENLMPVLNLELKNKASML